MPIVKALLVAAGLAAIGYLVAVTGVEALLTPARLLSWRVVVLVLVPYAVAFLLHTVAWRLLFTTARIPLGRLLTARLAGEALNEATLSIGGEPVKAYLLRSSLPLIEVSTVLMVEKTAITIAQVLFLGLGLAVALPLFDLPESFVGAMAVLLGVQALAVGAFVAVQVAGLFGRVGRLFAWVRSGKAGAGAQRLATFDHALAVSYTDRRGPLGVSVLVHLAAWVVNSVEVYLFLRWLGVGASFADALVIDAFGTGVRFMAFAIPGALGALEGGYMLAFSALGLGGGLGLSFTLIRRVRIVVWSAAGVLVLLLVRSRPVSP